MAKSSRSSRPRPKVREVETLDLNTEIETEEGTEQMSQAPAAPSNSGTRRRLSDETRAEIMERLANGESGSSISAITGVSTATIYKMRGPSATPNVSARPAQDSDLRNRLVSFAVRTLRGQEVTEEETIELKSELESHISRLLAQSI